MKRYPKVSIIIPLYKKTPYFFEAVGRCLELDYPNFEVLVGVDGKTKVSVKDPRVRILKTGQKNTGPAEKRDIGVRRANGSVIAFLDDDSYPERDWLKKSVKYLTRKKIAAVCGPGLTPPWDSFSQKITGSVLGSYFGSGPYYYRFVKGSPRYVDDYPAYNMIVAKAALSKVGGWGTKFYGGEDTALCLKLINAGEKIYYHPDIVVYHHRRHFPFEYMKQVGNVGKHRGYFVKKYPKTSLRISYFGPALFTLSLPFLAYLGVLESRIFQIELWLFILFYIYLILESVNKTSLSVALLLPFAIIVNYLAYGFNFILGLITSKMDR